MSATEPPATPEKESEFLSRQALDARAAIARTVERLQANLAEGADPREWTRRYPRISVGAAAIAGFAAAWALVPSKEEQALKHLEKIRRAMTPPVESPEEDAAAANGDPSHRARGGKFAGMLVKELLHLVRPALMSLFKAGLAASASPATDDPDASPPPSGDEPPPT